MTTSPCPTCNSTMGYYDGPNDRPRCLNCFHDTDAPKAKENPPPQPNVGVDEDQVNKQIKAAEVMTTKGSAQDKAVRGPKEPKKA